MPSTTHVNCVWTRHHVFVDLYPGELTGVPGYRCDRAGGTPDWLLVYTIGGAGVFQHQQAEEIVVAGDAVLLKPGTPHHYRITQSTARWHLCWVHFHAREHWIPWLNWPVKAPGLMRLSLGGSAQRARVIRLLRDVYKSWKHAHKRATGFAMNRLEEALLALDEANGSSGPIPESRIDHAVTFIRENLLSPLPVKAISDAVGLSESRLAYLFPKYMGQTPQQYVEHQRIARAKLLLESTDRTVAQTANAVGYDDPFYFTRRFRLSTGFSPIAYRRHFHNKEGVKLAEP